MYSSSKGVGLGEGENIAECRTTYLRDTGEINSFCSERRSSQDDTAEERIQLLNYQQEQQLQLFTNFRSLNDSCFDVLSPPFQLCRDDIAKILSIQSRTLEANKTKNEKGYIFPSESLRMLQDYENRLKRLKEEKINLPSHDTERTKMVGQKQSTDAILRLAGEIFIQSHSPSVDDLSVFSHPFASSFFGLSDEVTKDVELVRCLLVSAEMVGQQQFVRASKLLDQCDDSSSDKGTPIQRLVYYFSEALREKVDKETGRITSKGLGKKQSFDSDEAMRSPNSASLACHKNIPFGQIGEFTGMQAIMDSLGNANRIHFIDLEIRNGMVCTILMQALAARHDAPLEQLTITAVGTKSRPKIEETCKRLESFAQTLSLPLSIKIVIVSNMLDLNENLFEVEAEETVAVYSSFFFRTMIQKPKELDHLMRVIRNINPIVMVVFEVEASLNSPVFVKRFIETLFFHGAYFDCLEDCMERDDSNRLTVESNFFGNGIRNYVASEGEERTIRHVKISVWKAFFSRFGMVEIELSESALYQANLVAKTFDCWSSCTLDMDGKSLLMGWKRTPLHSLSAWKFV